MLGQLDWNAKADTIPQIELKLPKDQPGITWPALFATSPVDLTAARQYTSPPPEAPFASLPSPLTARRPTSPVQPSTNGSGSGELASNPSAGPSNTGPSNTAAKKKNWDAVVSSISDDEGEDRESAAGGGDAALQKLFAGIYANADPDTKRAMIKSFTESGGTALSTDWSSVGKGECRAVSGVGAAGPCLRMRRTDIAWSLPCKRRATVKLQ